MDILSLPDNEPFIAGTDESIDICSNQIMKLSDASICHCRRGKARIEIDMQAYELTENTQILLLPGSIFNCTYASDGSMERCSANFPISSAGRSKTRGSTR